MKAVLRITIGASAVTASVMRGQSTMWTRTAPHGGPGDLAEAIMQVLGSADRPKVSSRATILLERPIVQVRSLCGLPPVRARELQALVAQQESRFFRKNGKPLVTAAAWDNGSAPDRAAKAAAVEEPWVEAVTSAISAAGVALHSIQPAELAGCPPLDLVAPSERKRRRRADLTSVRRIATVAIASWVAACGLWVMRIERERTATGRQIAQLEGPARVVADARRRLDRATQMVTAVDQARRTGSQVSLYLGEIISAMPDSMFLTSMSVDADGNGRLTGVAPSAAGVVAALDVRGKLVNPRLEGTPARDPGAGGREMFTIRFGRGDKR